MIVTRWSVRTRSFALFTSFAFVLHLLLSFHFCCFCSLTQVKLRECEAVLKEDFFLNTVWEEFVENARLFIFETYCRIHQVRSLHTRGPAQHSMLRLSASCSWDGALRVFASTQSV
jgi:hypothetical protein